MLRQPLPVLFIPEINKWACPRQSAEPPLVAVVGQFDFQHGSLTLCTYEVGFTAFTGRDHRRCCTSAVYFFRSGFLVSENVVSLHRRDVKQMGDMVKLFYSLIFAKPQILTGCCHNLPLMSIDCAIICTEICGIIMHVTSSSRDWIKLALFGDIYIWVLSYVSSFISKIAV